jgi:hypothetical protein
MGRACGLFALPLTSTTRPVPRIARFAANDIFISFGTKTCCASSADFGYSHPFSPILQKRDCRNHARIQNKSKLCGRATWSGIVRAFLSHIFTVERASLLLGS